MRGTITALALAGILSATSAHAMNEPVWLVLNGGGSWYSMSSLNREIASYNAAQPSGAMTYPKVHQGKILGGAVGYEVASRWNVGLGIDRLYASSAAHDASGTMQYLFTTNAWRVGLERSTAPLGTSGMKLGLGFGLLQGSGKLVVSPTNASSHELKILGKAPLYDVYGGGDWWFAPQFAVTGSVGYRYAKMGKVQVGGMDFVSSTDGSNVSVDYSGPYIRLGLRLMGKSISD